MSDRVRALRLQDKPDVSTPVKRLRHVVEIFDVQGGDDRLLVTATSGIWDEPTGLTWGDLVEILALVDPNAGIDDDEDVIHVGDLVENVIRPELDYRRVIRIEGDSLWLDLAGGEIGPLPVANYRVVAS